MATGTAEAQYIQDQLDKTRAQVKLVDLLAGLMVLAAGVITFLLLLAVIDAWVLDLGRWGRVLSLSVILLGGLAFFALNIAPLIFRKVNPVYAARTIERAEPRLKNGLINFLMFRGDRGKVEPVVYQAIEHQAAVGLSHAEIETAVDKARLIRLGYLLAGVVVVCGAYKVLSPKDPFQTFARVAAPLADIARPTRVQIHEVEPGEDITVYYGSKVTVSALIRGLGDDEQATLIYSTADGQQVDRRVVMRGSPESTRYTCGLADSSVGIQQDLMYRIEAGDASTRDYHIRVRTAPTIAVESLKYEFPAYTNRQPQLVSGQGDVIALEGTKVTVTAIANLPIREARIELKPGLATQTGGAQPAARTINMSVRDGKATGHFYLELRADRQTAAMGEYLLHFTTQDGYANENPAQHRVEVIPDLSPDIELLAPRRERTEVPVNKSETIEVRGLDPDYALSRLTLRAASSGSDLINAVLLDATAGEPDKQAKPAGAAEDRPTSTGHLGQAIKTYEFRPATLKLKPGDEVVFWAVAEDNRTSVRHQLPEPNVSRTRNYYIKITAPENRVGDRGKQPDDEEKAPKDDADPDKSPESRKDQSKPENSQENGSDSSSSGSSDQGDEGEGQQGDASGATSGSDGSSSDQSQRSDGSGQQGDSPPEGDSQTGGGDGSKGENSQASGSGAGGDRNQPTDSSEPGAQGETSDASNTNASDGSGSRDAAGQPDLDNAQVRRNEQPDPESQPSDEPLHDGEAFEKILEHLNDKKEQPDNGQSGEGDRQDDANDGTENRQPAEGQTTDGDAADNDQRSDAADGERSDSTSEGAKGDGQETPDPSGAQNTEAKREGDPGAKRDQQGDGQSGDPRGPAETMKDDAPRKDNAEQNNGNGQGDKGDAGSGRESDSDMGSPEAQGENRDRQKTDRSDDAEAEKGEEAKSPSTSDKQSDSQGETSGDRSGGGGEGGGQNANQAGRDTSGSNTPSDEGAGAADERGDGESSSRGGDDRQSEDATGREGERSGDGSGSRDNPEGDRTVQRTGDRPGPDGSSPQGGGVASDSSVNSPLGGDAEIAAGEKAKLEHAEKATDLALDYLRDKNAAEDRQLLDKLGWTEEELNDFVKRWSELKRKAREGSGDEQRELSRSLRSLGLRPPRDQRRAAAAGDDQFRDLQGDGYRATPPAKYLEQFKAFQRGAARAEN